MLEPWVRPGMTVLEPGPGMGFFTIELARRVGPDGRVVAVDVQERMLRALERRMKRRGLGDRVQTRPTDGRDLPIADLRAAVDLCTAIHVVHEVPDTARFFEQVREALKPDGTVMVVEPAGHVDEAEFEEQLRAAEAVGLAIVDHQLPGAGPRSALLRRNVERESRSR
jgi:cyclopropane fatty-acyl-phospholipid synthase-like methyltransferase